MKDLRESGENYLEVILEIEREGKPVRSVEIARRVGVTRASVSKALTMLREKGFVEPSYYSEVALTDAGHRRAAEVRARHELLCRFLRDGLGVPEEIAARDACRIEHIVSEELLEHIGRRMARERGQNRIRLVAADMDGTLLDSGKRMPPGMLETIHALAARGVRFAAASGRQYYDLLRNFPGMERDMLFICENGAMTFGGGELLDIREIPYEMLTEPVALARSLPGTYVILCGEQSAWYESTEPVFFENASMYYARLTCVPDVLEAAKHDRICKIAVFHHRTMEEAVYPTLRQFENRFQVALSGDSWVDLMTPGVNKGEAMRRLQERFDLTPDECMAFGDYLNDRELMQAVKHSYGMANAHPALRAVCRYEAPSNDEYGVLRVLQRVFGLSDG